MSSLAWTCRLFNNAEMSSRNPQRRFKSCRRFNEVGDAHALTFSTYHRQPFLVKERCRRWLADAIALAKTKHQFHVWAYVIMPEHVHLLIWPCQPIYSISRILTTIKQSVARNALLFVQANASWFLTKMLDRQPNGRTAHRFWQRGGGYDRNLSEVTTLLFEIDYFHCNPIRRGLCERVEEYLWSSAADYLGIRKGPIPIDFESLPTEIALGR